MDIISLLVILGIIGIGIWFKMLWLAGIGVIILLAYLAASKPKRAPSGGGKKVKIRPIIIQRKYTTESIYPKKVEIVASSISFPDWWESALNTFGKFLGKVIKGGKK